MRAGETRAITGLTTALARFARGLPWHGNLLGVLKGAMHVFSVRIVGAALTYASMVLLARWLGAHDFGIYAYVFVVVTLLGIALSFGFNSSTLRFLPSYLASHEHGRAAGFLAQSYAMVAVLGVAGALLTACALFGARGVIDTHYFWPLLFGLLCVPIWTLLNQLEATARALGQVHTAYVPGYVIRPLLLVLLVAGVLRLRGTATATDAVLALVAACAVAAFVQAVLVYRRIRQHLAGVTRSFQARYWFVTSLGFLLIDGFRMLLDNTDVVLIGKLLDPQSVGIYFAVIRTGGLVAFVSFSTIALAVPKFAEVHTTGTREELQQLVSGVIQLMFWPSLLIASGLAVFGPFILSLFGADFTAGYYTLLVVLGGLVLRSATGPVEYLLNVTGHHADTVRVYALAALANVALSLWLVPLLGVIGAAIATYSVMLSGNFCLYLLVRKRLRVHASVFPLRQHRVALRPQ